MMLLNLLKLPNLSCAGSKLNSGNSIETDAFLVNVEALNGVTKSFLCLVS